ncbi:MAG: DUF192 domain-containing protein [Cognatishimia sp.]|uniref:DUF192 domain-containing protein n=1 Tax=Cognatishimia sp. TaxID=2211648 RepID=UPI003B8B6FA5
MTLSLRFLKRLTGALVFSLITVSAQAACRHDTVHLRGDWGEARFSVEVADNASERAKGLMDRMSMPMGQGMLFVYHQTRPVSFWMRNTFIPLDIIYLDQNGTVVNIHHQAKPLDETPLPSILPTRYVLEINGGLAKALGMTVGSALRHPAVLQTQAAWPCHEDSEQSEKDAG